MRAIILLLSLAMLSACAHHAAHHHVQGTAVLDPTQTKWVKQLEAESSRPPRFSFGGTGRIAALTGAFPLVDRSSAAAADWLMAHRQMFGLAREDRLSLTENAGEAVEAAHSVSSAEPSSPSTGAAAGAQTSTDVQPRVRYVFDVTYGGYPHSGMQITATVTGDPPVLAGVFNTYTGVLNPRRTTKFNSEALAWLAAEAKFGTRLEHVEAVQVWFDPSWALQRVAGTQELHWRLVGRDPGGAMQYAFVRASDNWVSYHTPPVTRFAVHQTHKDSAGDVLWDSQTLPNGCVAGSGFCTGIALSESLLSREIVPQVVDLWYTLSSPGGAQPFVWPFSGLNRAPFDNHGGRAINVVIANPPKVGRNIADFPSRDGTTSTYNFPEGTVTRGYVGHEYGHVLLGTLKFVHPGTAGGTMAPAASFTEAMADFIGIVTEHRLTGAIPPPPSAAHWQTDFSIGDFTYGSNGGVTDSPPVAWDIRAGNCSGKGRERLGRAFINAWGWDVQIFGTRPRAVGEATYRAWWIDIMRSFALLPDFGFPTIKDFYDATLSRNFTYPTRDEYLPAMFLANEMEKLGLDAANCF